MGARDYGEKRMRGLGCEASDGKKELQTRGSGN